MTPTHSKHAKVHTKVSLPPHPRLLLSLSVSLTWPGPRFPGPFVTQRAGASRPRVSGSHAEQTEQLQLQLLPIHLHPRNSSPAERPGPSLRGGGRSCPAPSLRAAGHCGTGRWPGPAPVSDARTARSPKRGRWVGAPEPEGGGCVAGCCPGRRGQELSGSTDTSGGPRSALRVFPEASPWPAVFPPQQPLLLRGPHPLLRPSHLQQLTEPRPKPSFPLSLGPTGWGAAGCRAPAAQPWPRGCCRGPVSPAWT